jgi:diacylglycerol kinase (ATP)
MSRKILFFINPVSGTKNKFSLEKRIVDTCRKNQVLFEILFTSKDGNYDFLKSKVEEEGITDVVVCSGDGSLSPVIASLLNVPVNVGIIPMGSGNGLARTARIPSTLDRALEVVFRGNASPADAFLINNELSCHVCGLGFDALVAYEFSTQQKRGLSSYTKQALKHFFSAKTYDFTIDTDGSSAVVQAFLICIANSNQFGNNFKIARKASICDGLLDIVIVKKNNKLLTVIAFLRQILSGRVKKLNVEAMQKSGVTYFQTRELTIKNPGKAPFHIDGDPKETSREFKISVLPAAYLLLQP